MIKLTDEERKKADPKGIRLLIEANEKYIKCSLSRQGVADKREENKYLRELLAEIENR